MEKTHSSREAFRDAGLHFGIVGTLAFTVFVLIFRQDWTDQYRYLSYVLPVPVIALLLTRRFAWLGGLLLVGVGIGAALFDARYSPGHPGQITGRGLGYTLVFVSLPLIVSGIFYCLSRRKDR
jgi:hypothetical protein